MLIQEYVRTPVIEARGLCGGYGKAQVIHDLDLSVYPGEIVVLGGPNGAGKTTTLLTMSGDLPLLGGQVYWLGSASRAPLSRRAREGLGLVTEERSIFSRLSVHDNLRVSRCDYDYALALFPELVARLKIKAGMLSGGEQQMLALARILACRPKVLLADELSLGLAPLVIDRLLSVVRSAADSGVGVLLVEQHVKKVMQIANRVFVLRGGRMALSGYAEDLKDRLSVVEGSYFSEDESSSRDVRVESNVDNGRSYWNK